MSLESLDMVSRFSLSADSCRNTEIGVNECGWDVDDDFIDNTALFLASRDKLMEPEGLIELLPGTLDIEETPIVKGEFILQCYGATLIQPHQRR